MRSRSVVYLLAGLLWAVSSFEVFMLLVRWYRGTLAETPIVGALLTQGTVYDHLAPILVLAVFGWVLLEVLLHALRIRREYLSAQQLQNWSLDALKKQLGGRRAANRARLVAQYSQRFPQQLHEILPAAASLDATALENSYSLTKVFVWVLPVLGFIGTAWGMTHAIGGFSQALQETSDIKALTDRLSQFVIPGLANAFAVTMMALGASIITHLCVTTVQSWDAAALNSLDQSCVSLLGNIPRDRGSVERGGPSPADMQSLFEHLRQISQEVEGLARKSDLGDAGQRLSQAAEGIKGSAAEVTAAARALQAAATLPYNIKITRGNEK